MPSLILCGTKTPLSGDDLRFFCACACLFRGLQLCLGLALVAFVTSQKNYVNRIDGILLHCEVDGEYSSLASAGVAIMYTQAAFSICLAICGIVAAIPAYIVSGVGTPTDSEPRRALLALCYCNLSAINLFRVAAFIVSVFAIMSFHEYCACIEGEIVQIKLNETLNKACPDGAAWLGVQITLNVTHAIDILVVLTEIMYFIKPCTSCPALLPAESKWTTLFACCIGCCSTLTCCMCGGFQALTGDFGDLALVMSNYTNSNRTLDVTVSDVGAGLVMVKRRQREKILETRDRVKQSFASLESGGGIRRRPLPINENLRQKSPSEPQVMERQELSDRRSSLCRVASTPALQATYIAIGIWGAEGVRLSRREILQPGDTREKLLIAEGARFIPLAVSIYTWILFILDRPLRGSLRLMYRVLKRCACFCPSPSDKVHHDYPWEPHLLALEEFSGLDPEDIVFASFKQSIVAVPYMISLDHEWKSVVITIRGTGSMESMIADIAIRPEELSAVGEKYGFHGAGKYCHRGMLASSQWLYDDIMTYVRKISERTRAFSSSLWTHSLHSSHTCRHGKLKELMEGDYKNYQLRVVGHSLGAGCAAVLSLFFKPSYPDIRCLAFSPPGCVFSEKLAEESSAWVTSYVLDADVVARLAIKPFEELRNRVLKMICRIKVSKREVFALPRSSTSDREELAEDNERILYKDDEIPESEFKQQVDRFLEFQQELKQRSDPGSYIDLFPPGEIIQLFRTKSPTLVRSTQKDEPTSPPKYIPRWIYREDLQHVIVSSHLISDHLVTNVSAELQKVAESQFALVPPFYKMSPDDIET